jgi:uncharacterized membrane protein
MSDPNGPAGNGEYGSGGPGPDLTGQPGWTPRYRPTEAIGYGWRKFKASPSMLLVPMIVVVLVLVVVGLIFAFVAGGGFFGTTSCSASNINGQVSTECGQPFWRQLLGAGLGVALLSLVGQVLLAGLFRGATLVTEGKDFSLGQLLEGYSKTHVILASIFISVATGIATVLCYLPGVLIAFLTSYTLFFIVDQQLEAAEAIAESVKMVWHNFGNALLYFILAVIVLAIGALLLGIGLLVAAPVVVFGLAYTYRRLQDLPVVP